MQKLEMSYRKGKMTLFTIFIDKRHKSIDGFVNATELNRGV
jgi:hypothetical protein